MGSKKKKGQARRAWEDKTSRARKIAASIDKYMVTDVYAMSDHPNIKEMNLIARKMFTAWDRQHRVSYDIDPTLYDELIASDVPAGDIPVDVITRLPHTAPLVLLPKPVTVAEDEYHGFVMSVLPARYQHDDDYVDYDRAVLSFMWIGNLIGDRTMASVVSQNIPLVNFDGTTATFGSLFDVGETDYARADGSHISLDNDVFYEMHMACLQIALYLTSQHPDMREVEPPSGIHRTRKDLTVVEVGWRVGAALGRARAAAGSSESNGRVVAPHMRRAHWHRYWTGPRNGQRETVVRWIPPLEINADKGEIRPTIRPVK